MAVVTCLAVIPPELGKDNFGLPAKILYVPAGSVEVYRKNAVWREAFETIAALPWYSCLWAGGAENEISPYPAKGYGDISFSESAVSRRIIFPVGLALFLRHGGADWQGLRRWRGDLTARQTKSSEERIVIVTLFRTLAFNGLLSVFCGGLPDSIGNGWFGIKVLGAAARNLSVCSDRKDGAAESMLQTTSSYGTTCGSVVNQPFFPGRIRKSRD